MARVDFAFDAPDRLRMACEVLRKHCLAGREFVVYSQDKQLLGRFDRLLWGFEATAFIPHVDADDPLAAQTPVRLTHESPSPASGTDSGQPPWLLNLDADCPPGAEQFERILEIVSSEDADKQSARLRWRQYQNAGHELHAHDISGRGD